MSSAVPNEHEEPAGEKTKLVGYKNFKRHNPMSDRFEVGRWVGKKRCHMHRICHHRTDKPLPCHPSTCHADRRQVHGFHHLEFYCGDATVSTSQSLSLFLPPQRGSRMMTSHHHPTPSPPYTLYTYTILYYRTSLVALVGV